MVTFPMTLTDPNLVFKTTAFLNISKMVRLTVKSYYSTLIGNHIPNKSNGAMFGDLD